MKLQNFYRKTPLDTALIQFHSFDDVYLICLGAYLVNSVLQNIFVSVTRLICLLMFSSASAQTQPNGTYCESDFGEINLTCASLVICFATYESGESFLYLTSPNKDNQFHGYWAEPDASKSCPEVKKFPNISTDAWGRVLFLFDPSGNSWEGAWAYCDGSPVSKFNGTRGDNQPARDNGVLDESLYGFWLPAPDSGAGRDDLFTLNPDGTMVMSDGAGWNIPGTWKPSNGQLFFDDQSELIPFELLGHDIMLSGVRHERYELNDDMYDSQSLSGGVNPGGVYITSWRGDGMIPTVGEYALHYTVLGQPDSFVPGGSQKCGPTNLCRVLERNRRNQRG